MVRPFSQDSETFISIINALHKFRTYNSLTLESLAENYIWFADMDKMNDPFEGILSYPEYNDFEKVADAELMWTNTPHVDRTALQALRNEFDLNKVAFFEKYRKLHIEKFKENSFKASRQGCFSALTEFKRMGNIKQEFKTFAKQYGATARHNNLKFQKEEIRMWSYYGDGLRGFRITYDPKLLLTLNDIAITFINYQDTPESVDFGEYLWHLQFSDAQRYKAVMENKLFQVKGSVWSYEKELRIRSSTQGAKKLSNNTILSITFGKKMPNLQRRIIRILAQHKNPDVRFFEADIVDSSFGIAYSPMNDADFDNN